jgi:hypothetical protein
MNGAFYDHGKTGIRGITPRSTAIDKGGHDVRQHYERICNRLGACNLAISPENARSSRLARLAWGAPNSRHADKGSTSICEGSAVSWELFIPRAYLGQCRRQRVADSTAQSSASGTPWIHARLMAPGQYFLIFAASVIRAVGFDFTWADVGDAGMRPEPRPAGAIRPAVASAKPHTPAPERCRTCRSSGRPFQQPASRLSLPTPAVSGDLSLPALSQPTSPAEDRTTSAACAIHVVYCTEVSRRVDLARIAS